MRFGELAFAASDDEVVVGEPGFISFSDSSTSHFLDVLDEFDVDAIVGREAAGLDESAGELLHGSDHESECDDVDKQVFPPCRVIGDERRIDEECDDGEDHEAEVDEFGLFREESSSEEEESGFGVGGIIECFVGKSVFFVLVDVIALDDAFENVADAASNGWCFGEVSSLGLGGATIGEVHRDDVEDAEWQQHECELPVLDDERG